MVHVLAAASSEVDSVLEAAKGGKSVRWIVPKKAHSGDRALFHLPSLGLAGSGEIGSEPEGDGHGRYRADVCEIKLLNLPVPLAFIRKNHPTWKWPTYPRSYATIDGSTELVLDELLKSYQSSLIDPLTEGTAKSAWVTTHERNPIARQRCIEHYGPTCFACKISFGKKYGETAEGFIHVHHLKPVSGKGGKYTVDPIRDLRPLCPNCHAVVHLQTPPLTIRELKGMLKLGMD